MLAQHDSYSRLITQQQITQSYQIFKSLLKPNTKTSITSQQILKQSPLHNPHHKVVSLDCHRTRSANFNQQQKKKLQSMLNYFVRIHRIEYKQGLNQIAAPFLLFSRIKVPLNECYLMFQTFFLKYSLNFYYDKDFTGLEMFFKMITIVLRYHCPSLSRYLAVYDIEPQIYALVWLMTLFSSKLSLQMTYLLWSYLIAQKDRYLLFFIVVGIIIRRKNQIIQTKNNSIFKIVTDMIFKSQQQLQQVLKISLIIRKNTPKSLINLFQQKQIFDRLQSYTNSAQLLNHINQLNLFIILPKELYIVHSKSIINNQHNKQNSSKNNQNRLYQLNSKMKNNSLNKYLHISNDINKISKSIQFVILDLRKQKSQLNLVNKSSNPSNKQQNNIQIYQIDIYKGFQTIQTSFLDQYLESISYKHFVILLTGFTFQDSTFSDKQQFTCALKLIQVLNSYSFPYLSILEGGYTALSIYQQQYRLRVQFKQQQNNMNSQNYLKDKQIPSYSQNKINGNKNNNNMNKVLALAVNKQNIEQNIFLQQGLIQQQINVPISLLFKISQLKDNENLKIFKGENKLIILVTQSFVILVQDKQGLQNFISYLQHNTSIIPYFYSHFNSISMRLVKILPVYRISKIKSINSKSNAIAIYYKKNEMNKQQNKQGNKRNTISIKLQSQQFTQQQLQRYLTQSFTQILTAYQYPLIINKSDSLQNIQSNKSINISPNKSINSQSNKSISNSSPNHEAQQLKSSLNKQNKLILYLKDNQQVKQLSLAIQQSYKMLLTKKYSIQLNQK